VRVIGFERTPKDVLHKRVVDRRLCFAVVISASSCRCWGPEQKGLRRWETTGGLTSRYVAPEPRCAGDRAKAIRQNGEVVAARKMFARYVRWYESEEGEEWRTEVDDARYDRARRLSELVADQRAFTDEIGNDVREARAQLKLGTDVELPF
jgi:hypothetical protein